MMRFTYLFGSAAALALGLPLSAATTFDNGLANSVDTPLEDIVITNATEVTLLPGGSSIAQDNASMFGQDAVTIDGGSTLNIAGGTITGGPLAGSNSFSGDGIDASGSSIVISSGSVSGGANSGGGFGGPGIFAISSELTVTGGTIAGGAAGAQSGTAIEMALSTFDFSGGEFLSPSNNGVVLGLIETTGTISGGQFESGSIWGVGPLSTINVIGTDLQIVGSNLTGTLADGSDLNVELVLFGGGTVNLIPEPSTLALLGLGGLFLCGRRTKLCNQTTED